MINREDVLFDVGEIAYELYTKEKLERGMYIYPNQYSSGVYIKYIPTGLEV